MDEEKTPRARHGTLPDNIVQIAKVIMDAGVERATLNEALGLVCTGRVPRECDVQIPLIDLLCEYGASPESALRAAAAHGEHEAANALLRHGARLDLPVRFRATSRSAPPVGKDRDGRGQSAPSGRRA